MLHKKSVARRSWTATCHVRHFKPKDGFTPRTCSAISTNSESLKEIKAKINRLLQTCDPIWRRLKHHTDPPFRYMFLLQQQRNLRSPWPRRSMFLRPSTPTIEDISKPLVGVAEHWSCAFCLFLYHKVVGAVLTC